MDLWELMVPAQYGLTLVSSGFNACYFAAYTQGRLLPRRRVGALVMAVLSAATFVESLVYTGALGQGLSRDQIPLLGSGPWLLSRLLASGGSLLVSGLILRSLASSLGSRGEEPETRDTRHETRDGKGTRRG